jgi:predicted nuclease with TOPRIM domain
MLIKMSYTDPIEDYLYEQHIERETVRENEAKLKQQISDMQDKFDELMVFVDTLKNSLNDTQSNTVEISRELIEAIIDSVTQE